MTARTTMTVVALLVALGSFMSAGWIHAKAVAAQLLIRAAWERNRNGAASAQPWPWADTAPVARLTVLQMDHTATRTAHETRGTYAADTSSSAGKVRESFIVLSGMSGRTLAFGPAHDSASVLPGDVGNSVIAAHRDTHFRVLKSLQPGDWLRVERADGRIVDFRVTDVRVVDSRTTQIALGGERPRLTLVTCYPFDAIRPGGPLRFVVTADSPAGAGLQPPQRVPHAAAPQGSEGVEPRELASHGELMDGFRAFVRDDALEIQHVPDGYILRADAGATEHVARIARYIERHAAVVPLGQ